MDRAAPGVNWLKREAKSGLEDPARSTPLSFPASSRPPRPGPSGRISGNAVRGVLVGASRADPRSASPSGLQPVPPVLEKGVVQEREIQAGETHEYRIAAQAGDYARVTVDQAAEMDVAVRLPVRRGRRSSAADGVGGQEGAGAALLDRRGGGRLPPGRRSARAGAPGGLYKVDAGGAAALAAGDAERVAAGASRSRSRRTGWALRGRGARSARPSPS